MVTEEKIQLQWFQDTADVLEQKDGRTYVIGTLTLHTLAGVIVGCTYYHHLLPVVDAGARGTRLKEYRTSLTTHNRKVADIVKQIRSLVKGFPEISENNIHVDDPDDPQFLDLAISIQFGLPFLPTDPYTHAIVERLRSYIQLVGSLHELELLDTK
jgi:hypothetical protein